MLFLHKFWRVGLEKQENHSIERESQNNEGPRGVSAQSPDMGFGILEQSVSRLRLV
jgi:hypothetical protein